MSLNLWLVWGTSRLPGGNRDLIGKSLKTYCLPLDSSGVISLYLNFIPYCNISDFFENWFIYWSSNHLEKLPFSGGQFKNCAVVLFSMFQFFSSIIKKFQLSKVFWTFFWKLFIFNLPYSFHTYFSHLYIHLDCLN